MNQVTKVVVVSAATYAVNTAGAAITSSEGLETLANGSIAVFDESGALVTTATTAASLNAAGNSSFEIFYKQNNVLQRTGAIRKASHHYKKCDSSPATKAKYTINLGTFPVAPTGTLYLSLTLRSDARNFSKSPIKTFPIPIRTTDTETTLIAKVKTAMEGNDFHDVVVTRTAAGVFTVEAIEYGIPLEINVWGTPVTDLWGVTKTVTTPASYGIGTYLQFVNDSKYIVSETYAGGGYRNNYDQPIPSYNVVDGTNYTVLDIHSTMNGGSKNATIIDNQVEIWVTNTAVATALNTIFTTILDTTYNTYL